MRPPLKFLNTGGEKPSVTHVRLQNQLKGFNYVRKIPAYEDNFQLHLHLEISDFEVERDHLVPEVC